MIASDFLRQLKHKIEERTRSLSDSLGRGGAEDYPAYCKMVGRIKGLNELDDIIKDLLTKTEDADGQQ